MIGGDAQKARPAGRLPETLPLIPYRVLRYSVFQASPADVARKFSHRRSFPSLRYKCRRLKEAVRKRRGKNRRRLRKTATNSALAVRQSSARPGVSATKRKGEAFPAPMRKYTASAKSCPSEISILVSEISAPETGERCANGETPLSALRTTPETPESGSQPVSTVSATLS